MNLKPNEGIDFESLFRARLQERGISLKKLSEISGIALKHIENLHAGKYENLPAAPYLRGYLAKIGTLLDLDGEAWWEHLKNEGFLVGSGPEDQLPRNRFAQRPIGKRVFLAIAGIAVLVLAVLQFSRIFGRPDLIIFSPAESQTKTTNDQFLIEGRVANGDRLTINGEPVVLQENGSWQKNVLLQAGLNAVEIKASKFLGRETTGMRFIVYEPQENKEVPSPETF